MHGHRQNIVSTKRLKQIEHSFTVCPQIETELYQAHLEHKSKGKRKLQDIVWVVFQSLPPALEDEAGQLEARAGSHASVEAGACCSFNRSGI